MPKGIPRSVSRPILDSRAGRGPDPVVESDLRSRTGPWSQSKLTEKSADIEEEGIHSSFTSRVGCVRPLSLFYSDASADGVEERSLVPRSRSHAQLRRNVTMSHAFSCVQPAFIDL
ncbi:hypothetical protein EVAR_64171_1 [Eumeta japonica]|uniref:Uncharacterized protein n=1 Tax=Eumeta variegata TaxID=151549 RepID=A0A4C1ZT25_EUMVA|nr:hypothetical protein EVAR_64171_1 [Eumeta japonica]